MKKYLIIVAGGSGTRMQAALPKQFLLLAGKPVLQHTLERMSAFDADLHLILALPHSHIDYWRSLARKHDCRVQHTVVEGGNTRFHSVQNALASLTEPGLVAIHDGVRPLASLGTWMRTMEAASVHGAAIPVIDLNDSVRQLQPEGSKAVDRTQFKLVQTPQCFQSELILAAYAQPYQELFTDDASVVEAAGHSVRLVDGNPENIKITRQLDLLIASELINSI